MSLTPEIETDFDEEEDQTDEGYVSYTTYRFDFDNKRLTNELITGRDALKQFIVLQLQIRRYVHPIYSSDVGSEIDEVIKDEEATIDYKIMEIERFIEEALIYTEWVDSVSDIEIQHIDDAFHVSFIAETAEGLIDMEEVFENV